MERFRPVCTVKRSSVNLISGLGPQPYSGQRPLNICGTAVYYSRVAQRATKVLVNIKMHENLENG